MKRVFSFINAIYKWINHNFRLILKSIPTDKKLSEIVAVLISFKSGNDYSPIACN